MEDSRKTQLLWFLLATAILAALIYLSDYREFISVLASSEGKYVAIAVAWGCFTLLVWSVVWHRFLLLLDIPVEFQESVRLLLAGTFLNSITPLGRFGGEPFIAHLIARRTDTTFQQALSSVSSSDISNALPFVTYGTLAILYVAIFGTLGNVVADIAVLVVVLVFLSALAVYLLWFGRVQYVVTFIDRLITFERGFGRWQPYINSGKERGRELLLQMRKVGDHPRNVLTTICISHFAVLGHIGAVYFVLLSVGVEPVPRAIIFVVTLSAFLTFAPTPGGTGAFEAGFAGLVVAFFPVTAATATSIAILYRIGTYLPGVVLGYVSLLTLGRIDTDESSI